MKLHNKFNFIATALLIILTACGESESENVENSFVPSGETYTRIELREKLSDTSWRFQDSKCYDENGKSLPSISYRPVYDIITLSKDISYHESFFEHFKLYLDGILDGYWNTSNGGSLYLNPDNGSSNDSFGFLKVMRLSSSTLQVRKDIDDYFCIINFSAIGTPPLSEGGNGSGGGASSYEKPEISFSGFSATKTSLTIKYRIYNKDKAAISNSYIYYGTTSNPSSIASASVSGVYITATISNLKSGTVYWVKCKATGKGGTTETGLTKCITNY